ncbi:unnamed protein product, partial [Adineta steineri]
MSGNKCQPSASESYQSSARKRNIVLNIINNKLFFMSINLAEFYFGQHIEVGLESFSTTYATIATNAVSSCHFIFIDAELQEQQFLYLSHFSIECEVESCGSDTTLIEVTDQIVENINKYNETNEENQLLVDRININKILVGSGVDDIVSVDPPGIWISYNCYSKIVHFGIEWCSDLGDYDIPHTAIDFNHVHVPHLYWILIVETSESVLKRLNLNWHELIGF